MKKNLCVISAALFMLNAGVATSYAADTAVITVTANVVASACTIGTPAPIDLGTIPATSLETAGATSSWSSVQSSISLSNCPAGTTSVEATFTGTPATNGDTNGYKNEGSGSQNISVQLADDAATPNMYSNGIKATQAVANKAAQFNLKARLYTNGVATPGAVKATITANLAFK